MASSEEAEDVKEKASRGAPRTRSKAMADIKGDRLCVDLGASQVRRRLKGHGYGVRKDRAAIESKLPYPEEVDMTAEFG